VFSRSANRIGSLETGNYAALVVFNRHPFDYRTTPELGMVNGEVYFKHAS